MGRGTVKAGGVSLPTDGRHEAMCRGQEWLQGWRIQTLATGPRAGLVPAVAAEISKYRIPRESVSRTSWGFKSRIGDRNSAHESAFARSTRHTGNFQLHT